MMDNYKCHPLYAGDRVRVTPLGWMSSRAAGWPRDASWIAVVRQDWYPESGDRFVMVSAEMVGDRFADEPHAVLRAAMDRVGP